MDRFCDAMISIRQEIRAIEDGRADPNNNVLKHAPHPASVVLAADWNRGYSREEAAFPAEWVRQSKFWPSSGMPSACLPAEKRMSEPLSSSVR